MLNRNIVVIGASSGGLEVLKDLVAQLPAGFPAAIFITWHMSPQSPALLAEILERYTSLAVTTGRNGEAIENGHIYVASPDHHLMVEEGMVRVSHGPKENRFRPSVDVLFRSAAAAYGPRVIGVVLSGSLDDGAAGLYAVKQQGGLAIVQDPVEAPYYDMPMNALRTVEVVEVLRLAEMGERLVRLVSEPLPESGEYPVPKEMELEVRIAREDQALESGVTTLGENSIFTCPECHGTLLQIKEGRQLRFRCHTGHAFSVNSLLIEITKSIEDALWNGVRVIEESQLLLSHMATHLEGVQAPEAASRFRQKSQEAEQRAQILRQAVLSNEVLSQEKLMDSSDDSLP